MLTSLDKFDSVFGLKLGYLLFAAAEQLSRTLQGKDTALQEAITAANLAKNHYTLLRREAEFDKFYQPCVSFSEGKSGEPVLPRYRELPPDLTMELLLISLNVQRITIECNTMKLATKLKRN